MSKNICVPIECVICHFIGWVDVLRVANKQLHVIRFQLVSHFLFGLFVLSLTENVFHE